MFTDSPKSLSTSERVAIRFIHILSLGTGVNVSLLIYNISKKKA
jgi:hypothetical protein